MCNFLHKFVKHIIPRSLTAKFKFQNYRFRVKTHDLLRQSVVDLISEVKAMSNILLLQEK